MWPIGKTTQELAHPTQRPQLADIQSFALCDSFYLRPLGYLGLCPERLPYGLLPDTTVLITLPASVDPTHPRYVDISASPGLVPQTHFAPAIQQAKLTDIVSTSWTTLTSTLYEKISVIVRLSLLEPSHSATTTTIYLPKNETITKHQTVVSTKLEKDTETETETETEFITETETVSVTDIISKIQTVEARKTMTETLTKMIEIPMALVEDVTQYSRQIRLQSVRDAYLSDQYYAKSIIDTVLLVLLFQIVLALCSCCCGRPNRRSHGRGSDEDYDNDGFNGDDAGAVGSTKHDNSGGNGSDYADLGDGTSHGNNGDVQNPVSVGAGNNGPAYHSNQLPQPTGGAPRSHHNDISNNQWHSTVSETTGLMRRIPRPPIGSSISMHPVPKSGLPNPPRQNIAESAQNQNDKAHDGSADKLIKTPLDVTKEQKIPDGDFEYLKSAISQGFSRLPPNHKGKVCAAPLHQSRVTQNTTNISLLNNTFNRLTSQQEMSEADYHALSVMQQELSSFVNHNEECRTFLRNRISNRIAAIRDRPHHSDESGTLATRADEILRRDQPYPLDADYNDLDELLASLDIERLGYVQPALDHREIANNAVKPPTSTQPGSLSDNIGDRPFSGPISTQGLTERQVRVLARDLFKQHFPRGHDLKRVDGNLTMISALISSLEEIRPDVAQALTPDFIIGCIENTRVASYLHTVPHAAFFMVEDLARALLNALNAQSDAGIFERISFRIGYFERAGDFQRAGDHRLTRSFGEGPEQVIWMHFDGNYPDAAATWSGVVSRRRPSALNENQSNDAIVNQGDETQTGETNVDETPVRQEPRPCSTPPGAEGDEKQIDEVNAIEVPTRRERRPRRSPPQADYTDTATTAANKRCSQDRKNQAKLRGDTVEGGVEQDDLKQEVIEHIGVQLTSEEIEESKAVEESLALTPVNIAFPNLPVEEQSAVEHVDTKPTPEEVEVPKLPIEEQSAAEHVEAEPNPEVIEAPELPAEGQSTIEHIDTRVDTQHTPEESEDSKAVSAKLTVTPEDTAIPELPAEAQEAIEYVDTEPTPEEIEESKAIERSLEEAEVKMAALKQSELERVSKKSKKRRNRKKKAKSAHQVEAGNENNIEERMSATTPTTKQSPPDTERSTTPPKPSATNESGLGGSSLEATPDPSVAEKPSPGDQQYYSNLAVGDEARSLFNSYKKTALENLAQESEWDENDPALREVEFGMVFEQLEQDRQAASQEQESDSNGCYDERPRMTRHLYEAIFELINQDYADVLNPNSQEQEWSIDDPIMEPSTEKAWKAVDDADNSINKKDGEEVTEEERAAQATT